jgi:hypothetical protein
MLAPEWHLLPELVSTPAFDRAGRLLNRQVLGAGEQVGLHAGGDVGGLHAHRERLRFNQILHDHEAVKRLNTRFFTC